MRINSISIYRVQTISNLTTIHSPSFLNSGFPVPQVVLMCNGEPVNEEIKLKPVVKGNIVELQLEDAARADSGKYELKLKNELGEASVPLELNVLGMH